MVTTTLYARQQKRHRCIEQSFGLCGRVGRWGRFGRMAFGISCHDDYLKILGYFLQQKEGSVKMAAVLYRRPTGYKLFTREKTVCFSMKGMVTN